VAADQFAVAEFMTVELQAGDIGYDRLQQRLAFKERQARCVAAVEMQNIECVKDQVTALDPNWGGELPLDIPLLDDGLSSQPYDRVT
jgi:hypothetical protein